VRRSRRGSGAGRQRLRQRPHAGVPRDPRRGPRSGHSSARTCCGRRRCIGRGGRRGQARAHTRGHRDERPVVLHAAAAVELGRLREQADRARRARRLVGRVACAAPALFPQQRLTLACAGPPALRAHMGGLPPTATQSTRAKQWHSDKQMFGRPATPASLRYPALLALGVSRRVGQAASESHCRHAC
jgi:hypothetical protein